MSSPDIPVAVATAHYEVIGSGKTGHAESVRTTIRRRSPIASFKVYFRWRMTRQLNRQGPDSQYRSAIFFTNDEQKGRASLYRATQQSADLP